MKLKFLSLHTPAVTFDQSCDCGKLKHGTVKRHVILTGLLFLGAAAILVAFLLSVL